jgi:hypothetical protein
VSDSEGAGEGQGLGVGWALRCSAVPCPRLVVAWRGSLCFQRTRLTLPVGRWWVAAPRGVHYPDATRCPDATRRPETTRCWA